MTRRETTSLSPDVATVRHRIEEWRQTRRKRTRMPEDLWSAAVGLAREQGIWSVSQALRVSYDTLKRRLTESSTESTPAKAPHFVDLGPAVPSSPTADTSTTIELTHGDGAQLTMRLPGHAAIDVASLIDAFCGWRR